MIYSTKNQRFNRLRKEFWSNRCQKVDFHWFVYSKWTKMRWEFAIDQLDKRRGFSFTVPHSTSVGIFVKRNFESFRKMLFASFQLIELKKRLFFSSLKIISFYFVRSPTEHSTKIPFDGNDDRIVSSIVFSVATQSEHLKTFRWEIFSSNRFESPTNFDLDDLFLHKIKRKHVDFVQN